MVKSLIAPPTGQDLFFRLALSLILLDLAFMAIDLAARVAMMAGVIDAVPPRLKISTDHSWAEMFLYAKWLGACMLFALAWRRSRVALYGAFSFLFLVVLCDDSFSLHEGVVAQRVAEIMGFQAAFGLRAIDFAELTIWALLGLMIVTTLIVGYRRTPPSGRVLAPWLFGSFAALLVCGIGVDMLHVVVTGGVEGGLRRVLNTAFDMVEDGGEMIVGSLVVGYAAVALASAPELQVQRG